MVDMQYENLLFYIMLNGTDKADRTGVGTRSKFGLQLKYDLANGFPLITTKRLFMRGITEELLWFIRGETNIKSLNDKNVHIWDEWADDNGELGPVYGKQWRSWETPCGYVDQLAEAIDTIKNNPDSRRILVNSWNVGEIDQMALPPCHCLFQFYVADGKLSCQLYQRSCDMFLGVPFNIASYALLTHMVANVTGLEPGEFIWTGGDCHIYQNHFDQVNVQLQRQPYAFPTLTLTPRVNIEHFDADDVAIHNYQCWPAIKAEIAV